MIATVIIAVLLGLSLNLAFSSSLIQPDWALALLLASLLAHRKNWVWVVPCIFLHDMALHWSIGINTLLMALIPPAMVYFDQHLGVGLPQRIMLMCIAVLALLQTGWGSQAMLLTLCLCVPLWHLLARQYAKAAA